MKFSWVLVIDLGISKGWHTILRNFQGWELAFSRISKGKVTNLKILEGGFQKSISTTQPVWSFSGIFQWTSEFHQKSQITILLAWQLELFEKKNFQTGGTRVEAGFHTGVEIEHGGLCPSPPHLLRGLLKMWWRGAWVNTWRGHGGGGVLKNLSKNTREGVHLLVKLSAISLQACKFTKNELLHTYFSRAWPRF